LFSFFNQRFYFELFYNRYIVDLVLLFGGQTSRVLDKGSIELIGPYGLEKGLFLISKSVISLDSGIITNYALYILINFIFYIAISYVVVNTWLTLVLFSIFYLAYYLITKITK